MGRPTRDLRQGVNLSPRHLQAIGEVAVRWAELEDTLCDFIWDLANLRLPGAYAVTAHLNERTLVNILGTLTDVLVKGPEAKLAEEIQSHLTYIINTVYPKRNAMIHSDWGHSGKKGKAQILPIKARGKLKIGPREDYSAKDIRAIADEIMAANEKLHGFHAVILEKLQKWVHIRKPSLYR